MTVEQQQQKQIVTWHASCLTAFFYFFHRRSVWLLVVLFEMSGLPKTPRMNAKSSSRPIVAAIPYSNYFSSTASLVANVQANQECVQATHLQDPWIHLQHPDISSYVSASAAPVATLMLYTSVFNTLHHFQLTARCLPVFMTPTLSMENASATSVRRCNLITAIMMQ